MVRDRDGSLRAFSNVCLHRMSTLLHGRGRARAIVCPYHAWTYNLDGTLRGAPAMSQNEAFDRKDYCLPRLRCEEWLGWVFVTLNPDAPPVAERLAEVEGLVADFAMETYVETFFETHVWDTNWKVLAENFMESYHLPVCHAGDHRRPLEARRDGLPAGARGLQLPHDPQGRDAEDRASPTRRTPGSRATGGGRPSCSPSTRACSITLTPGYFWYLTLHPQGPGQVRIGFGGGMSPDFVGDPDAQAHFAAMKALLDEVNVEDRGCTEKVFRGLSVAGWPGRGTSATSSGPNYDFARYLASRVAG